MNFDQLVSVILEKDNRPKILKIGLPQEVADYLHNMSNKYSLWFADKINKMPAYQASRDKLRFVHSIQTQMQSILDWVAGEQNVKLNTYNWENALEKSIEYHNRLTVTHRDKETNKVIKEYPDGFYWVDIESSSDSCERSSMGHCASTGKGDTLYSLRKYDKTIDKIESFITLAISPDDGIWYQCKGKKNSKPKEEYYPYIVNILIEKDVFQFKTEYQSSHDFTSKHLKEYLEEHPEEYPNTDDILEKIEENLISFKDFEKILEEYDGGFDYYFISINEEYTAEEILYPNFWFSLRIKKEETPLPIDCLTLDYRSKGRKYLERILESVSIESVDEDDETVNIFGTVQDDDSTFTMDDEGLASFRRQCEYFQELNKRFDYNKFLKEELEKILALDGCIKKEILHFQEKIENYFKSFYSIVVDEKTLELKIYLKGGEQFKMDYAPKDLSYFSAIPTHAEKNGRYNLDTTITLPSLKKLKEQRGYKDYKHSDYALLSIFWDFIKNQILDTYSEKMLIQYDSISTKFNLIFKYDFSDEDTDYDKEFELLKNIKNNRNTIQSALDKFINEYFIPFIKRKKPFTIDDFDVTYDSSSYPSLVTKGNDYIGTISKDTKITPEYLANQIKERNLDFGYYPLDEKEVEYWLSQNVSTQPYLPNFKEFFEGRVRLK